MPSEPKGSFYIVAKSRWLVVVYDLILFQMCCDLPFFQHYWMVQWKLYCMKEFNLDMHVFLSCSFLFGNDVQIISFIQYIDVTHKKMKSVLYTLQHHTMDIIANKVVTKHSREISCRIWEIADVPEGSPCFLCQMTDLKECIWDEIGDDIVARGLEARIWFERTEGNFTQPAPIAACDKAARYAC